MGGTDSNNPLTNYESIIVGNGATVVVPKSLRVDGSSILTISPSSALTVGESLLGTTSNPAIFKPQGTVTLNGGGNTASPRLLEAMSKDLGTQASAFSVNNFAYGGINLANNTYLKLVDQSDNSSGTTPEAVYTNSLIISTGSTLDLNGLTLYTRAFQLSGAVVNGNCHGYSR